MNIATLLWAFDIRPANDAAGNPILPSADIVPYSLIQSGTSRVELTP